jgi:iron complex outermembrane receptor protein
MKFREQLGTSVSKVALSRALGMALAIAVAPASLAHGEEAAAAAAATTAVAAAETTAAAGAAVNTGAVATTGRVEEVTVTARHRNESAQDVPIAITAISAAQLESQGATTVKQVLTQLPSLNIQGFSGRNQTITIRGLGTNAGGTNDGLEQGVGLYIDGVYRPRTGTVITDLMDIERVQLLRGPQGTLFGKNVVAGVIDITTREPTFDPELRAEVTYGNHNQFRSYIGYSFPINDRVAVRLSYLHSQRDGLIYNTTYDEKWDNQDNNAAKADILFTPNDNFRFRLIADYSRQTGDMGFYSIGEVLPTTLANGTQVRGFYKRAQDVGYTPIPIDPFARQVDIDSSQYDKMPSWGIQGKADWDLDALTLTSITAYRNWKWLPNYDGDQIGANVATQGIVITHQQQFSQEFRATSATGGAIDYTGGLYFFWQKADDTQVSSYGRDASVWLTTPNNPTAPPSTLPSAALDGLSSIARVVPQTFSYAAYGQATWHATPELHLTGGLRLTYEHKTGLYDSYAGTYGDDVLAPLSSFPANLQAAVAAARATYAATDSYTASNNTFNVSGTFIAAYDITPDINVYASYSRGYKSPGINLIRKLPGVDIFVKPEVVDNYEIGLKSQLLDGLAEFNLALFWTNDHDYQANYINYSVTPARAYISNIGDVRSRGVELDARVSPVEGLTLGLSGTYNDATYTSYTNAPSQYLYGYLPYQDLSGQRASGASKWAFTASAEYTHPLGTKELYIGGDVGYRSGYYAAVNLDPFSYVDAYTLVGLHAGVRDADGRWEASVWVRNLLDENYYNTKSVSATYGVVMAALGEPRMFGVTLKGKF